MNQFFLEVLVSVSMQLSDSHWIGVFTIDIWRAEMGLSIHFEGITDLVKHLGMVPLVRSKLQNMYGQDIRWPSRLSIVGGWGDLTWKKRVRRFASFRNDLYQVFVNELLQDFLVP